LLDATASLTSGPLPGWGVLADADGAAAATSSATASSTAVARLRP
jgi:hypothetical protein